MVGLAQLYQSKEQEVSQKRENVDALVAKLKRKLEAERRCNEQLKQKQKGFDLDLQQVKHDNDTLSAMLAQAREDLSDERAARAELARKQHHRDPHREHHREKKDRAHHRGDGESRRVKAVSGSSHYINQLHTSTSSNKRYDKENESLNRRLMRLSGHCRASQTRSRQLAR